MATSDPFASVNTVALFYRVRTLFNNTVPKGFTVGKRQALKKRMTPLALRKELYLSLSELSRRPGLSRWMMRQLIQMDDMCKLLNTFRNN